MVKAARVPGALYAAMQPMRAAKAPAACRWRYGGSPTRSPTRSPAPGSGRSSTTPTSAATPSPSCAAIDKATMLDAAARLPSLGSRRSSRGGRTTASSRASSGERLAAVLPDARLAPIAGSRTFVARTSPRRSPARSATSCARPPLRPRPEARRSQTRREGAGRRRSRPLAEQRPRVASAGPPGEERAHVADRQHQPRGRGDLQVGGVDWLAAEHAVARSSRRCGPGGRGSERRSARTAPSSAALRRRSTRVDRPGRAPAPPPARTARQPRAVPDRRASRAGACVERPPQQPPGDRLPDLVAPLLGAPHGGARARRRPGSSGGSGASASRRAHDRPRARELLAGLEPDQAGHRARRRSARRWNAACSGGSSSTTS